MIVTDRLCLNTSDCNMKRIDIRSLRDELKVCKSPHKGWYFHYYDQNLVNYSGKLAPDDFLLDFPGLNHVYFRLGWSFLEPEEGRYNWELFDSIIEKWRKHGYNFAFRVTCKETDRDQIFATPEWVKDAGAKGTFIPNRWNGKWANWEPDYSDPVFLEKLENFHRAFAEHYGGKPWVEYIDIGSYGDWGEGHTVWSSKRDWPLEVLKKHVELHQRCYKDNVLFINDDHIGCRYSDPASWKKFLDYFAKEGLAFRDDSVCVNMYAGSFGYSTLRYPEFFEAFWRAQPVDLECEHYHSIRETTWQHGFPFAAAVEEAHATYISFQGFPREWLEENRHIAERLANRCGYWYFINAVELPEEVCKGSYANIRLEWKNSGVAPAYNRYRLALMLQNKGNPEEKHLQIIEDSGNLKWMPGAEYIEAYGVDVPDTLTPGLYSLRVAMYEEKRGAARYVELALKDTVKGPDGYYEIAEINIK